MNSSKNVEDITEQRHHQLSVAAVKSVFAVRGSASCPDCRDQEDTRTEGQIPLNHDPFKVKLRGRKKETCALVFTSYLASRCPTLFTEVAVETRWTQAASADVVTGSSVQARASLSAAVTMVTWQTLFTTETEEKRFTGRLQV